MHIPDGPDDLSPAWLTSVLRGCGALERARAIAFDSIDLGPDVGFVAQICRIRLFYDAAEASAPRSLIAKFSSPDGEQRAHGLRLGLYEREVRFYKELAGQIILGTPRCYYGDIDLETGAHVLLLEDLGPVREGGQERGCTSKEATLLVREMARFHAGWWQRPELGRMRWIPDLSRMHDFATMQEAFPETWNSFSRMAPAALTKRLAPLVERAQGRLSRMAQQLYSSSPRSLVHFDLQRDNLFFKRSRNDLGVMVIDWQLMTRGNGVTDMALFLGENLNSELRRAEVAHLLATYHRALLSNGIESYPFERCLADFRQALLLRMLLLIHLVTHLPFSEEQLALHMDIRIPRNLIAVDRFYAGEMLEGDS